MNGSDEERLEALRAEIDSVERSMVRRLEPGWWAMVVGGAGVRPPVADLAPWVGADSGWQVRLGPTRPANRPGGAARRNLVTPILLRLGSRETRSLARDALAGRPAGRPPHRRADRGGAGVRGARFFGVP